MPPGRRDYLDAMESELKVSHPGRMIEGEGDYLFLREEPSAYSSHNNPEKNGLSWETSLSITLTDDLSVCWGGLTPLLHYVICLTYYVLRNSLAA